MPMQSEALASGEVHMPFRNIFRSIALFAGLLVGSQAPAQTFAEKTIRIVFSFSPGDAADILIRQLAPLIAARLPGRPTIVVENRPGAGGIVAANYLYNAASADGLTLGFLVAPAHQSLIGDASVKFDASKFHWVGAIPQTQVLMASKKLKIEKAGDWLKPSGELILALAGQSSVGSMTNRLFLDMVGARYRTVTGYPGQSETNLALARGEITLSNSGLSTYLQLRDRIRGEGLYDAVLQRGEVGIDGILRRNKKIGEIPTMLEAIAELKSSAMEGPEVNAYKTFVGTMAIQYGLVLPPKASDEVVKIFRQAVSEALNDQMSHDMVRSQLKTDYDFIDGAGSEAIVTRLHATYRSEPEIPKIAARLIQSK